MFSPTLTKKDVPDALWLPAEIRLQLEHGESPSSRSEYERSSTSLRDILEHKLTILSDKIGHIESVLGKLKIEERLRALEGGRPEVARGNSQLI